MGAREPREPDEAGVSRAVQDGLIVETDRLVLFWKPPAPFSQWTRSTFRVDGVDYVCAEQFMMAAKARLFGDEATRAEILATDDPRAHRALGRKVAGFEQVTWERERSRIVIEASLAKFAAHPELLRALLATGEKVLVEASPFDRIWGIGRAPDDPLARDEAHWRGLNLLGRALMEARTQLRARG